LSLGLALQTVALLGAAPAQPVTVPALAPTAQVEVEVGGQTGQSTTPAPVPAAEPAPDQAGDKPAILLEPLTDPAASPVAADAPAARSGHTPGDPFENFNRRMFAAHQSADRKFLRPAAMGYRHIVPKPVRSGLRNVFSNLGEPLVFLNDILQLKPGRAVKTFARFAANSTIGIGGLIDIAKTPGVKLPHRNNGFGNTLAYYGVGPGPYLFLPFVGPTTLRDFLGGQGDGLVLPLAVGKPFDQWKYQVPRAVITGLDLRAESDADLKALFDGAVDPYATLRSVYLQNRAGEIEALHSGGGRAGAATNPLDDPLSDPAGQKPSPLDDPLTDPAAPSPAPPTDAALNTPQISHP
jgi:phospholipid-binding lipoprotein MlaA